MATGQARPLCRVQPGLRPRHQVRPGDRTQPGSGADEPAPDGQVAV